MTSSRCMSTSASSSILAIGTGSSGTTQARTRLSNSIVPAFTLVLYVSTRASYVLSPTLTFSVRGFSSFTFSTCSSVPGGSGPLAWVGSNGLVRSILYSTVWLMSWLPTFPVTAIVASFSLIEVTCWVRVPSTGMPASLVDVLNVA